MPVLRRHTPDCGETKRGRSNIMMSSQNSAYLRPVLDGLLLNGFNVPTFQNTTSACPRASHDHQAHHHDDLRIGAWSELRFSAILSGGRDVRMVTPSGGPGVGESLLT